MKHTSKLVRIISIIFVFWNMHIPNATSATYLARLVSRANCLVPLPHLSPSGIGIGYTFFESISWDPKFWNGHHMQTRSVLWHHSRNNIYGIWESYRLNTHLNQMQTRGWRSWAGTVPKGDRGVNNNKEYRAVAGEHWELLDRDIQWRYRTTHAIDCNITTW